MAVMIKDWATIEDFAALFQYLWYRDFPMDEIATGAQRADWTIHLGIVVRNVGDLLGFVTRFETGGRKDAVLRSTAGDEIAVEWEWGGVWGNELKKLRTHDVWSKDGSKRVLKYAVFITYTHASETEMESVYDKVTKEWEGAPWPLLLILIDVEKTRKLRSHRKFKNMHMLVFHEGKHKELRSATAFPWKVLGTRWSY